MTRRSDATVDPELLSQLARAAEMHNDVAATFTLRNDPRRKSLVAQSAEHVARKVVDRATHKTRAEPTDMNVFPNIQSFVVCGPPELIEAILQQPEIDSATANYQSEDLLIRPVDVRPVAGKTMRKGTKRQATRKASQTRPAKRRRRDG